MPKAKLSEYKAKRDFKSTPEPSGARGKTPAKRKAPARRAAAPSAVRPQRFVVQEHNATRLHYDFRLEADGVLKSWAVPKGPTLDPREKRLAMHVEDHPLDYRTFEGIIPAGNYGAGQVIVWDAGYYMTVDGTDPTRDIDAGKIKFAMRGKKLNGVFTLVRMGGSRNADGKAWLLIKEDDDYADRRWSAEAHPESVKSGRTLADIKALKRAARWHSNRAAS